MIDFDTFTKLPKNVGELDKLIVEKGFEKLPKVQKSPNLVTLVASTVKRKFVISYDHDRSTTLPTLGKQD